MKININIKLIIANKDLVILFNLAKHLNSILSFNDHGDKHTRSHDTNIINATMKHSSDE